MADTFEHCYLCDALTGKAGRGEDSLYLENGDGPFCSECFDHARVEELEERNAALEAELAELQDHCTKWVEEANKRGNERDTARAELAAPKPLGYVCGQHMHPTTECPACERDKLKAELAAAKADYQREHDYITVVVSERDNLRAEVEALKKQVAEARE